MNQQTQHIKKKMGTLNILHITALHIHYSTYMMAGDKKWLMANGIILMNSDLPQKVSDV